MMLSPPADRRAGTDAAVPIAIQQQSKELLDLRLPSRAIQIPASPSRFHPAFAHSCPAGRPMLDGPSRVRHAPITPQIGSLPDPSFAFLQAPMPPLELPPPNREAPSEDRFTTPAPRPRETVVQFASSCPAQLDGFLTRMTLDDSRNLLSQSPSLAILRDMRRGSYPEQPAAHRRSLDCLSLDERDEYESEPDDATTRDSTDDVFMFEMP
ncbi:hypothetical protein ACHHYP_00537 [Achlya hypogyna]|uniref:Uncharacterized protein n=1 Tax=Achlya hypogyna TaxID=1202772 RepID=A0A1V9ZUG8_ACHHY|nr:hypothetical protein ACHHYP_00537 [Achlya hypogyna]